MAGSPHGGGGFGDPSPGKRGGGGGQQRVSNVCAVTIVQLHSVIPEPTGDGFRMASTGKEVSAVRLVARIVDVNDEPGKTRLTVEDSSGKISMTLFFTEGEDLLWGQTRVQLNRGVYVDIFATLKTVGGAMAVIPQTVKIVEDFNQITHHLLECMSEHLMSKYGPTEAAKAAGGGVAAGGLAAGLGARYGSAGFSVGGMQAPVGGGGGGGAADPLVDAVFNAFKAEGDSDDGASIDSVVSRLRSAGITRAQVESAVQTLTTDGFIYSTIDEQHFRATS